MLSQLPEGGLTAAAKGRTGPGLDTAMLTKTTADSKTAGGKTAT